MKHSARLRESLLGKALDPFSGEARKHVALVAFLAWVGLGARPDHLANTTRPRIGL